MTPTIDINKTFPRGIEVAACGLILREDGKLLFAKSPKWSNKWVIPGGHIEIGESIIDATLREVKEETNIDASFVTILNSGEIINSPEYKRPAHFIYFVCLLTTTQLEPTLDNDELKEYKWVTPEEALELDLAYPNAELVDKYKDYLQNK